MKGIRQLPRQNYVKECDHDATNNLESYTNRLAYKRAMLAESGGTTTDKTGPQKGGARRCWASPRGGGWSYIQKVNKVSVTVLDNYGNGGHQNFTRTMPFDKLSGIMTAAEVAEKKASGALIETEDGIGFHIAEKPTTPEGEHFTRPRAFRTNKLTTLRRSCDSEDL